MAVFSGCLKYVAVSFMNEHSTCSISTKKDGSSFDNCQKRKSLRVHIHSCKQLGIVFTHIQRLSAQVLQPPCRNQWPIHCHWACRTCPGGWRRHRLGLYKLIKLMFKTNCIEVSRNVISLNCFYTNWIETHKKVPLVSSPSSSESEVGLGKSYALMKT